MKTPIPPYLMYSALLLVAGFSIVVALSTSSKRDGRKKKLRVAFLGNSMQYFNDCPRLIQQMIDCEQDSCLRGGATITTLAMKGNGMADKFNTLPAVKNGSYDIGAPTVKDLLSEEYDFVVINDHTQSPARMESKELSKQTLTETYIPMLKNPTTIFIQTMAYRYPNMRGTEDLGDFEAFSDRLAQGVAEYGQLVPNGKVAPVGEAVRHLYQRNRDLWEKLYSHDHFHPSPHGTWLQACVLVCVMTGKAPPIYNPYWWDRCRRMQPPEESPLPLPTDEEAMQLREVACLVCGIHDSDPPSIKSEL